MKISTVFTLLFFWTTTIWSQTFYQNKYQSPLYNGQDMTVSVTAADNGAVTSLSSLVHDFYDLEEGAWKTQVGFRIAKTNKDGDILWEKNYIDENYNITASHIYQTHDGGYLVAGNVENDDALQMEGLLFKTDANGNKQWVEQMLPLGYMREGVFFSPIEVLLKDVQEVGAGVRVMLYSGIYTGKIYEEINNSPQTIETHAVTIELVDVLSQSALHKYFEFEHPVEGVRIKSLATGGYMALLQTYINQYDAATGQSYLEPASTVIHLDKDLNIIWESSFAAEGVGRELYPADFMVDENKNATITGTYVGTNNDPVAFATFLTQLNDQGIIQWDKVYSWSGTLVDHHATSIATDENQHIYVGGNARFKTLFSSGTTDAYILKTSTSGSPLRVHNYGEYLPYERLMDLEVLTGALAVGVGQFQSNDLYNFQFQANPQGFTDCYSYRQQIEALDIEFNDFSFFDLPQYEGYIISFDNNTTISLNVNYEKIVCSPFVLGTPELFSATAKSSSTQQASVVSPNPVSSYFQLSLGDQFDAHHPVHGRLFSLDGRLVQRFQFNKPTEKIHPKEKLSGVFILQLEQGQLVERLKVVFQSY